MAEITASMVKELRERSGAGMMDCKKALTESNGDFDEALKLLRERGEAIALKRSGRAAREGLIEIATANGGKSAAMIELNCETDFVAKNDDFKAMASDLAQFTVTQPAGTDINAAVKDGQTVSESVKAAIGKIGENIVLTRTQKLESTGGVIATYIHPPGKIGVLVELTGPDGANLAEFGRWIAMHIAAMNPLCVTREQLDPKVVETEREVYLQAALNEGKPQNIAERIVEGRLKTFCADQVLVDQAFVNDQSRNVADVLKNPGNGIDGPVEVKQFVRFQVGEKALVETENQD